MKISWDTLREKHVVSLAQIGFSRIYLAKLAKGRSKFIRWINDGLYNCIVIHDGLVKWKVYRKPYFFLTNKYGWCPANFPLNKCTESLIDGSDYAKNKFSFDHFFVLRLMKKTTWLIIIWRQRTIIISWYADSLIIDLMDFRVWYDQQVWLFSWELGIVGWLSLMDNNMMAGETYTLYISLFCDGCYIINIHIYIYR